MNREDIIKLAREAGCIPRRHPEYDNDVQVFATPDVLERFADLIISHKLDEMASKVEQDFSGAFGKDTCASWAAWIKEQK